MTELLSQSDFLKQFSILVAGIFTLLSIFVDIKDKRSDKITKLGGLVLLMAFLSIGVAVFSQIAETKENEEKSRQSQSQMIELLQNMRLAVDNIMRVLQPIDIPKVIIFFELECAPEKFKSFCASVQKQGKIQASKLILSGLSNPAGVILKTLPVGSSFSGSNGFDWSKWPSSSNGPVSSLYLHFFKEYSSFDKYTKGNCLSCAWIGDFTLDANLLAKNLSPVYQVGEKQMSVSFITSLNMTPRIISGSIMSAADISGSYVAFSEKNFLDLLHLKSLYIDTPRGQRIMGKFEKKTTKDGNIYFAKLKLSNQ